MPQKKRPALISLLCNKIASLPYLHTLCLNKFANGQSQAKTKTMVNALIPSLVLLGGTLRTLQLDLSYSIPDADLCAGLCKVLVQCALHSLTLDFTACFLGDDAVVHFATLKQCTKLCDLNLQLGSNRVKDAAMTLGTLGCSNSMRNLSVHLEDNSLCDAEAMAMCDALRNSPGGLQCVELNLRYNFLSKPVATKLKNDCGTAVKFNIHTRHQRRHP